jgi:hypothetical protein
VGTILYALLTGRAPFAGDTALEILAQVKQHQPESPSGVNPLVNRDLQTICLKCLEKDPAQRYASAEALADDLECWLSGKPIRARSVGRIGQLSRWCRRNPVIAGLSAASVVLLALLVVGLAASTVLIASKASEAQRDRDLARQSVRDLRQQLYVHDVSRAYAAWNRCDLPTVLKTLGRHIPAEGEPDVRGFEWFHLWALAHQPCVELRGHSKEACHVAYSPDGRRLASCSHDGTIKIWDPASATELTTLRDHKGDVNWVTFSPDGKTLASAGDDRTVRLWDVESGRNQHTLTGHQDDVMVVVFSPDGKLIASGGEDKTGRLWDLTSGRLIATLIGNTNRIDSLAFREGGKILVSGGRDGVARFWDVNAACTATWPSAATPVRTLPVDKTQTLDNQPRIQSIACHGHEVAVGCSDHHVRVFNADQKTTGPVKTWPPQVHGIVRWRGRATAGYWLPAAKGERFKLWTRLPAMSGSCWGRAAFGASIFHLTKVS